MIAKHELRIDAVCPVDGSTDRYDLTVVLSDTIPVETILDAVAEATDEPRFQESVTARIHVALWRFLYAKHDEDDHRFAVPRVKTVGVHSGVTTTVEIPG